MNGGQRGLLSGNGDAEKRDMSGSVVEFSLTVYQNMKFRTPLPAVEKALPLPPDFPSSLVPQHQNNMQTREVHLSPTRNGTIPSATISVTPASQVIGVGAGGSGPRNHTEIDLKMGTITASCKWNATATGAFLVVTASGHKVEVLSWIGGVLMVVFVGLDF